MKTKHTCADELIDALDDKRWAAAMETKKTCPACQKMAAAKLNVGKLAKAFKATGKPTVTIHKGKKNH
jgi:protein-disulfide isomerase